MTVRHGGACPTRRLTPDDAGLPLATPGPLRLVASNFSATPHTPTTVHMGPMHPPLLPAEYFFENPYTTVSEPLATSRDPSYTSLVTQEPS